jgi:hypothetical protein
VTRSTAAVLYRDAIIADLSRLRAMEVDLTPESMSSARALLEQVRVKLTMLQQETSSMATTAEVASAEVLELSKDIGAARAAAMVPRRPDTSAGRGRGKRAALALVSDDGATGPQAGAGAGAGAAAGAGSAAGAVTGAAAEGDGSSGGTGEERATTAGSESGSGSTAAGVVDTAAVEALDLLLRVVAAFSAHVKSSAATADRALHLSGGLPALQHMLATEAGRSLPPPHRCDDDAAELTRVAALCTASGSCPSPRRDLSLL